jgi:predicted nucleotidyltransferase component of viral defense system
MSAPPDPDLLEAIAADLGVDPAYVEKDWYAMRLVSAMAEFERGGIQPVFSGGTSLSSQP